jgi:signal transduction histidine kinase
MDNIITNVLDLARLEQNTRAKKQKIELIALLKEINANRQDEIESRKLNVEITGSCTVRADPLMMMQALRNLLDNAVKFTPDGGSITVTGEGSTLRISNDIAEEKAANVEQLCEAFVKGDSARSNRKGTGLGLSVVRQIAELNRLQFSLESSGHRFNVILRGKKGLRH